MVRSVIARRLQHNDKEAFSRLLREVLDGLVGRLNVVTIPVYMIVKVTKRDFEPYFQSPEIKEHFWDNIEQLQTLMHETVQFAHSFYGDELLEIYSPYSTKQWEDFFIELSHGIKRRIVVMRHVANSYRIPDFVFLTDIANTELRRTYQSFVVEFQERISWQLTKTERYFDEDYLETLLRGDL
jgi:hypothetical protein